MYNSLLNTATTNEFVTHTEEEQSRSAELQKQLTNALGAVAQRRPGNNHPTTCGNLQQSTGPLFNTAERVSYASIGNNFTVLTEKQQKQPTALQAHRQPHPRQCHILHCSVLNMRY